MSRKEKDIERKKDSEAMLKRVRSGVYKAL